MPETGSIDSMKFVFTCGGTAGHINPALAVALYLKENCPDSEFLFIGAKNMMEMDLVPREGYRIVGIEITNLSREISWNGLSHNIQTAKNILSSLQEARRILQEFRPDVVVGTGGYVCYPVIRAAHTLGIPTVVHESNATPGLTTKLLSQYADRILVGVEDCRNEFHDKNKVIVTGTPVRGNFFKYSKESAKAELGLQNQSVVLSVWGSLGSAFMNRVVLEMLPGLAEFSGGSHRFIHVTGMKYYDAFMSELLTVLPNFEDYGISVYAYIHDMPRIMSAADLIICRAGASTLSELCYAGKPAILVPSPNVTNNHQEKNARVLEKNGGAELILESEINSANLLQKIEALISDCDKLESMRNHMKSLYQQDSAELIGQTILGLGNH